MGNRPVTSIAQPNSIWYGSCKWEYSTTGLAGSWQSLGVARGVKFTENIETNVIQTDNGPDVQKSIGRHTCIISANLLELFPTALTAIRGGIDTLSLTSAGRTTDTDVYTTGQWGKGDIIWLQNQGATDTLATITKVKSVSTGDACTTYASTDDFMLVTDSQNGYRMGVALIPAAAGGDYLDTEALKIKYAYSAVSAYNWKTGGLTTITPLYHRLTNIQIIDGVTKYRYITVYSASMNKGIDFSFKSGNETDPVLESPFEVMGEIDSTRSIGDQLFIIEDQASAA